MSLTKKIRDNRDKLEIETLYRKKAKKRCPFCKRYSLFIKDKKVKCIRCNQYMEEK